MPMDNIPPGRRLKFGTEVYLLFLGCRGDFLEVDCEGIKDLLGGLGPCEGPGVMVPVLDSGADVSFERLDALVHAAAGMFLSMVLRNARNSWWRCRGVVR
jgi:hypothetical protein